MAQVWNFKRVAEDRPGESGEKSCFDYFKSGPHRHLIRELIQNSMDVPAEVISVGEPVFVSFDPFEISAESFSSLISDLIPRMEACSKACIENAHGRDPYKSKVEYLKNIGLLLPCLRVSDYNTTGMDYKQGASSKFKAGVRLMGASNKSTGRAGGSYGLGKTVGFVASNINAVYYSTMTEQGQRYGEGIIRLCQHKINNEEYDGDAFYDGHEGFSPDYDSEIPEIFRRKKPGTDVNILGYTPSENDIVEMKQEVLRSFWRAIMDKELIVSVYGEVFDALSLPDLMEKYFESPSCDYDIKGSNSLIKRYNPKPYYKHCVEKEEDDDRHFIFEASGDKYPNLGSAKLYIFKDESIIDHTDDRVVCMRDKKMAIEVRKPNTRKGFYGVFICDGIGSETLRFMENVTHDKWDVAKTKELGEDIFQKAEFVDCEIDTFIADSIKQLFPESENQEYTIPSMNQYLIASGFSLNANSGSLGSGEQGVGAVQHAITTVAPGYKQNRVSAQKIGRLVVRRKGGSKKQKLDKPTQEAYTPIDQPTTPNVPGTENPPQKPQVTPVVPQNNTPSSSVVDPQNPADGQLGRLSAQGTRGKKKSGRHAEDIQALFRVVPIMDDYGLTHRIIINSDANYTSCSMVIMVSGEEKDSSLEFQTVDTSLKITGNKKNIISGFNLVKGKNIIDIKFIDEDYHSLTIKAYEN